MSSFKLGINFANMIYDALIEKVNNLNYYGALDILKALDINEKDAIGILTGDCYLLNDEINIIVSNSCCENYDIDLLRPIEKFIHDFATIEEETIGKLYLKYFRGPNKRYYVLNLLEEEDCFKVLCKYFGLPIESIESQGYIKVYIKEFFNAFYRSIYEEEDYEDLLYAVESSSCCSKEYIEQRVNMYVESRKSLLKFKDFITCTEFVLSYKPELINNELLFKINLYNALYREYYTALI